MRRVDAQVIRVTTVIATLIALTVAITLPVGFFLFEWRYEKGRLQSEVNIQASLISRYAARNPEMWRFASLHIQPILMQGLRTDRPAAREVIDEKGQLVVTVRSSDEVPIARISVSAPIYESGYSAGSVLGWVSVGPILWKTGEVAAGALLLAAGAFFGFRVLPLRALRSAMQRASYLANHDALTGLPNRSLFSDRLEQVIAGIDRTRETFALLFIDLDHFKDVNDTLGHAAGDLLLCQVVDRLRLCLRKSDTLARLGGDEFGIIATHLKSSEHAASLAQRIIETLQTTFDLDGHEAIIGGSVGIAVLDPTEKDPAAASPKELLRKADLALYRAKEDGRATYRFFDEGMNKRLLERKTLEMELRHALANDEFWLAYQPQVELQTKDIIGVEALLRWTHPERGLVSPAAFIDVCEENGLIIPIGEWVLRRVCEEAKDWGSIQVAINVSPAQFRQSGLVSMIERVLNETGFDPTRLEIEITESVLLDQSDGVLSTLRAIKALGIHRAMDDFGTGYSSLNYLRHFPFDKVKIDRAFVRDLGQSAGAAAIVRAVVALTRSLGMRANAEGVETDDQAQKLLEEGCREVQGFLFGRPMPAAEFEAMLDVAIAERRRRIA